MWDVSLYAVNMFLLPLVSKKADLANSQAEQSQVGNPEVQEEEERSEGEAKELLEHHSVLESG